MHQHKKTFAPLTLDFTFKRAFATEKNKHILVSLINAFLSEKMESPIEDVFLINTVQIPETEEHRGAIFDLHCRDEKGNRFIVEMQLARQRHFIERLLFYICLSITSAAEKGNGYDYSLPRVYALSFLNFVPRDIGDIGEGDNESVQYISLSNDKHKEIVYPYIGIALVLLPKFAKAKEQCETIQDWWIYLFKHIHELEEIPRELLRLSEEAFKDLFETAKIARFTKDELFSYEVKMKDWTKQWSKYWNDSKAITDCAREDAIEEGIAIGEAKGIAIGIEQERAYIKSLQAQGLSPAEILEKFMERE